MNSIKRKHVATSIVDNDRQYVKTCMHDTWCDVCFFFVDFNSFHSLFAFLGRPWTAFGKLTFDELGNRCVRVFFLLHLVVRQSNLKISVIINFNLCNFLFFLSLSLSFCWHAHVCPLIWVRTTYIIPSIHYMISALIGLFYCFIFIENKKQNRRWSLYGQSNVIWGSDWFAVLREIKLESIGALSSAELT